MFNDNESDLTSEASNVFSTPKRRPSASPINSKKNPKFDSSAKKRMVSEALENLAGRFDVFEKTLTTLMSTNTEILKQNTDIKKSVRAIDEDNKHRIAENTKGIKEIKEHQLKQDKAVDERFAGLESDLREIKGLCENGGLGTHMGGLHGYSHETEHERDLAHMIVLSKSCVTLLGCKTPDLNIKSLCAYMTDGRCPFSLPGQPGKYILGVTRLGGASENPPYKIQLDCPATATSLIEQSRANSKRVREATGSSTLPAGPRFVQHFPQPYATKAREFRQQQAAVFERGGIAQIEYEGTTLILRVKSRAEGGEWLIMRGCEFRPMAVGRECPSEGESHGMTIARSLMDKVMDNRPDSPLAKSLILNTKKVLGSASVAKEYIGLTLSSGLTNLSELDTKGANLKYILEYSSREEALTALRNSKVSDLITAMDRDSDYLQVCCPVIGN